MQESYKSVRYSSFEQTLHMSYSQISNRRPCTNKCIVLPLGLMDKSPRGIFAPKSAVRGLFSLLIRRLAGLTNSAVFNICHAVTCSTEKLTNSCPYTRPNLSIYSTNRMKHVDANGGQKDQPNCRDLCHVPCVDRVALQIHDGDRG